MYVCTLAEGPFDGQELVYARRPPREIRLAEGPWSEAVYYAHYPRANLLLPDEEPRLRYRFAALEPRPMIHVPPALVLTLRRALVLVAIFALLFLATRGEVGL